MHAKIALVALMTLTVPLAGCVADGEGSASVYMKDAPTDEFQEIHVVLTAAYIHEGGDENDDENDDEEDGENGLDDGEEGADGGAANGQDGDISDRDADGQPGGMAAVATPQHGDRAGDGQANQFNEDAGWIQLVDAPDGLDIDLLNATGTRAAFLGEANLSAGTYTQIAVVVQDAYGIDENDTRVEMSVPSGIGRVVRSFEVDAGSETQIILDLDLDRALVETSQGWKLTPVFGQTQVNTVEDDESGEDVHEPGETAEVAEAAD